MGADKASHLAIAESLQRALGESVGPEQWADWRWHIRHTFDDPAVICNVLGLEGPTDDLHPVVDEFIVRVTPYYLNLLANAASSFGGAEVARVAHTFLPSAAEISDEGVQFVDGMGEEGTHQRRVISMLYPDRALLFVTNVCPIYCRYCFRKRKVGRVGEPGVAAPEIDAAIADIARQSSVRDVIISGGEPMMLSDDALVRVVEKLATIDHVGIVRIDTKFAAVCPQRFTPQLLDRLVAAADGKVLHMTFHFVHPLEVTEEVKSVTWSIAARGIIMNAYIPLLREVNNNRTVLKELFWRLALAKVRPYYLVQNVNHRWNQHFKVPIDEGHQLMAGLTGALSGVALPQYIVYLPNAGGKVVLTESVITRTKEGWIIKNHEGHDFLYDDPVSTPR